MSTKSELMQKRREVREEILALKDQIPSARILNKLGRAFKHNSLGYWLSNIILLNVILITPAVLVGLAFRELEKVKPVFMGGLLATELIILTIIVAHIAGQNILNDAANKIVEKISTTADLSRKLLWIKQTWSMQYVLDLALPFCILWTVLSVVSNTIFLHQFVGFGFSLWCMLNGLLAGVTCHIYLWTCAFASNLKVYQYEINVFSPADSEIINDISETVTKTIYMLATVGAITTLVSTSKLVEPQLRTLFSLPMLVIIWMAILTQFLLTRSTLGAITNRAKWKTLNRIREKINTLEATGDLSDKDTAERLFRLGDIHKQIMASNTKTFDLKSVTTLFSQLMLPLLGLLLGNLDRVLDLLQK